MESKRLNGQASETEWGSSQSGVSPKSSVKKRNRHRGCEGGGKVEVSLTGKLDGKRHPLTRAKAQDVHSLEFVRERIDDIYRCESPRGQRAPGKGKEAELGGWGWGGGKSLCRIPDGRRRNKNNRNSLANDEATGRKDDELRTLLDEGRTWMRKVSRGSLINEEGEGERRANICTRFSEF
ncbi:hypothetical protein KM043_007529 [Ampulex compressa]|nr:hypothetical protein KM043_007529 [Ampulex compressa]